MILAAALAGAVPGGCARRSEGVPPAGTPGPALRRVWNPSEVPENFGSVWSRVAISRDGRFFVYSDGGLARHDIATGEIRRLTDGQGDSSPGISPDGRQVAYVARAETGRLELRVVSTRGNAAAAKPRVVYQSPDFIELIVHDWTPDGMHLLAAGATSDDPSLWRLRGAVQMLLVSVTDGATRSLKTLATRKGWAALAEHSAFFSSDGRYVVYDDAAVGGLQTDIFFIATDGSREGVVVAHPGNDFVLGVGPQDDRVLFASERTGSLYAWTIPVKDGVPDGAAEIVTGPLGPVVPIGFTGAGVFYYRILPRTWISLGTFDPSAGIVAANAPVTPRNFELQGTPNWSRDGRYLAYTSYAGRGYLETRSVVILDVATRAERVLHPALSWARNSARLAWFPDGRFLLTCAANDEGIFNLYKIDVESGETSGPLLPGASVNFNFALSRDGKIIYYIQLAAAPHPATVMAHDLSTGRAEVLFRPVDSRDASLRDIQLSPDGSWLAVAAGPVGSSAQARGAVLVIPTGAGLPREVVRADSGQILHFRGWTSDGTHLLYNSEGALWRVARDGGERERLGPAIPGVTFHPDGQRIAFSTGSESGAEVWAMERFPRMREVVPETKTLTGIPSGR